MRDEVFQSALSRLQAICSRKEYCRYDLQQKLQQWNYPEASDPLLDALVEEGFLNEERYTRAYINDKVKFSKWGRAKIRYMLRGKQIPESIVDAGLAQIDIDAYRKLIVDEVAKKRKSLRITDLRIIEQKLMAFGQQRGYEWDFLRSAVEDVLG